ncbi:MAG: A24 family peptidase [Clostridia bacterium]|nr:A24 family peptidase [Clostridia bacterium]
MYRNLELTIWIGLMLGASYTDLRYRMVPDWLNLSIAVCSLPGFQNGTLAGSLCAIPFLMAAVCWGGIGGGDIKFMAACGMHLGFYGGLGAAVLGTVFLLVYHMGYLLWCSWRTRQSPKSYPMVPFLTVGCLVVLCAGG